MSRIIEALNRIAETDTVISEELSLKAINKINKAAWGEDALSIVLNNTSDKLDGYDDFGSGFDVSYQGNIRELLSEIIDIYSKAGIKVRKEGKNKISYDNGDQTVYITVVSDEDASTYTKNSQGYFIYVDNVE